MNDQQITLSVKFYTTSNGVKRASIIDNGSVLYMSHTEAVEYVGERPYLNQHVDNPTRQSK